MRHTFAALSLIATPVFADEPPRVVADIAPVRALAAQVMEGVGVPSQIIPASASPHGYAMRPSEARALQNADLVVWVGPALTHWLEEPLDTLAPDAARLTLMAQTGTLALPFRDAADTQGDHDADGHDEEGHKDHDKHDDHDKHADEGHADHDDHADDDHADDGHADDGHADKGHDDHDHAKKADHDDHAGDGHKDHDDHAKNTDDGHDGHGHDDHGHKHVGDTDPHGWLSPANAILWAEAIAQKLGEIDPENAATYTANAQALRAEVIATEQELKAALAPYSDTNFVVLHDAFQYFEAAFDVEAAAFIVPADGSTPGPARIKALRDQLAAYPAACAFTAPQENEGLLRTALDGQATRVAVLDPLGDGTQDYTDLLRGFGNSMLECFAAK